MDIKPDILMMVKKLSSWVSTDIYQLISRIATRLRFTIGHVKSDDQ